MFWKQLITALTVLSICVIIILMYLSKWNKQTLDQKELHCIVGLQNKDNVLLPRVCYEKSLKYNNSDHISVLKLSFLHLIEDRPTEAIELIEAYHILDDNEMNKSNLSFDLEYKNDITCVYLQSLLSLHSWELIESFIDTYLMNNKHTQNECILMVQSQFYQYYQSYQHALNLSVVFIHNYPDLIEAHVAMAVSLYHLNRTKEASSVFAIAYSLFTNNNINNNNNNNNNNNVVTMNKYFIYFRTSQHHEQLYHMLAIYGYILLQQDSSDTMRYYLAEEVFMQIISKLLMLITTIDTNNKSVVASQETCILLDELASLQYKLEMFPKSYVTVLKYLRHCSSFELNKATSLLDSIKDILGLPQYTTVTPVAIDMTVSTVSEPYVIPSVIVSYQDTATIASTVVVETQQCVEVSSDSTASHDSNIDDDTLNRELYSSSDSTRVTVDVSSSIQEIKVLMHLDTVSTTLDNSNTDTQSHDIINADTNQIQTQVEDSMAIKEEDKSYSESVDNTAEEVAVELFVTTEDIKEVQVVQEVVALSHIKEQDVIEHTNEVIEEQKIVLSPTEISARKSAKQYLVMAAAYTTRGDFEQTVKQLTKAMKKAPNYSDIYMLRGKAYLAMGDTKKASEDYLEVYEKLDRFNTTACEQLLVIATHLSMERQYIESVVLFNKIISNTLINSNEDVIIIYVNTLQVLFQFEVALDLLDRYINKNHSQQVIQLYAVLYEKTKQVDKAEEVWLVAIDRNMASLKDIGDFYSRQKDTTKALQTYDKYLSVTNSTLSIYDLASIHKKLGNLYITLYQQQQQQQQQQQVEQIRTTTLEYTTPAVVVMASNNSDYIANNDNTILATVDSNTVLTAVDHVTNSRLHAIKLLENAQMHYELAMNYGIYDLEVRKFFATYPAVVTTTVVVSLPLLNDNNNDPPSPHNPVKDEGEDTSVTANIISAIADSTDDGIMSIDVLNTTSATTTATTTTTTTDSTYEIQQQQPEELILTDDAIPVTTTTTATAKGFLRRTHDNTIHQSEQHTHPSSTTTIANKINSYLRNQHRWIIRHVSASSLDLATIPSLMGNHNNEHDFIPDRSSSSNSLAGKSMKSPGLMSSSGNIANNLMRGIEYENHEGSSSSTAFELLVQQQEQLQEQQEQELIELLE